MITAPAAMQVIVKTSKIPTFFKVAEFKSKVKVFGELTMEGASLIQGILFEHLTHIGLVHSSPFTDCMSKKDSKLTPHNPLTVNCEPQGECA
jgi:hypothetical protein